MPTGYGWAVMVLIPTSITLMIFSWGIGLASDPFKVQEVFVDGDVLGSQDKMNALQSLMVVIGTRAAHSPTRADMLG